jgi:hypothetical protein
VYVLKTSTAQYVKNEKTNKEKSKTIEIWESIYILYRKSF